MSRDVLEYPGVSWSVPGCSGLSQDLLGVPGCALSQPQPAARRVPPVQEHQEFYTSAVRMAGRPRRLQHLARVAVRRHLGPRCHSAVPRLALPPALRRYLQLPIEGLIS